MLDDPDRGLMGPPKPGRGRNRERLVYLDSLEAEQARRHAEAERHARPARRRSRADGVAAELADLRARVARLEAGRGTTDSADVADLRWAMQQLNAVTDLLRDAAAKEAAVRRMQGEATAKLNAALLEMGAATELVTRADQLRSEVVGTLLAPRDISDG